MSMELLFMVCFLVGIGLTLLSVILGHVFDIVGVDGLDIGNVSIDVGLPTSPMVYVLFSTVFGGVGMILQKIVPSLPSAIVCIIAAAVALVIAMGFYRGILIPLRKAQNTSAPAQEELVGVLAKVQESIPEKGYGEIAYVVNGNSYTAPAKATDGHPIPKGAEVSICWVEQYVFYVVEV